VQEPKEEEGEGWEGVGGEVGEEGGEDLELRADGVAVGGMEGGGEGDREERMSE